MLHLGYSSSIYCVLAENESGVIHSYYTGPDTHDNAAYYYHLVLNDPLSTISKEIS
jgi:hypothetical protein